MSPNWRWCLKIGLLIALIDLAIVALSRGQDPTSELSASFDLVDQIANVALFSLVGYRSGQQTGRATAGAEAGVITSLLPAVAAAAYLLVPGFAPTATEETLPLINRLVGVVAFNIALGGISAWLSGWLGNRNRARAN